MLVSGIFPRAKWPTLTERRKTSMDANLLERGGQEGEVGEDDPSSERLAQEGKLEVRLRQFVGKAKTDGFEVPHNVVLAKHGQVLRALVGRLGDGPALACTSEVDKQDLVPSIQGGLLQGRILEAVGVSRPPAEVQQQVQILSDGFLPMASFGVWVRTRGVVVIYQLRMQG